jgi:hypothetical protein
MSRRRLDLRGPQPTASQNRALAPRQRFGLWRAEPIVFGRSSSGLIRYRQPVPGGRACARRARVDRLARGGLLLVLASAVLAVAAGALAAVTWQPSSEVTTYVDPCPNPPCFGGGGLPPLAEIPGILPLFGFLLAAALGLPGLLLTVARVVRRADGQRRRVLPFAGPLLVLVFMEVVPHLLNPCVIADAVGDKLPAGCSRSTSGADVAERWHTLHHAVVGAVPAAVGFRVLLRRRRPDLVQR